MEKAEGLPLDLASESNPLCDALEILDSAANDYYTSCSIYSRKPSGKLFNNIEDSIERQMMAFKGVLGTMEESSSPEELASIGRTLIAAKSEERSACLNRIARKQHFNALLAGTITIETEPAADSDPQSFKKKVIESCTLAFLGRIESDTTEFYMFIAQTKPGRRAQKLHEIKTYAQEAGRQSLDVGKDVGKIALGTAIGMLAAKAISRKL